MKKRSLSIDVFRLIAAVLIIIIHTSSLKNGNSLELNPVLYFLSSTISRYAVPIFMMITGYFYFKNRNIRKRILKSLIWFWGLWMIIYSPIGIKNLLMYSGLQLIKQIIMSLLSSSVFFWGSWYLLATFFGLVVVTWLSEHNKMWLSCILAILFWLISAATSNYFELSKSYIHIIGYPGFFSMSIFTGIIWITISYYIVKNRQIIKKLGNIYWLVFGISITFLEFLLMIKIVPYPNYKALGSINTSLSLPLGATIVFVFILNHSFYVDARKAIWMRNMSTLMFFVQFGIIDIIQFLFKKHFLVINTWEFFFLVLIFSFLISLFVCEISKVKIFRWLRYLYVSPFK